MSPSMKESSKMGSQMEAMQHVLPSPPARLQISQINLSMFPMC